MSVGHFEFLITSCWLFTARRSTWPGNHLLPCMAELVGSCVPIHAYRCLPCQKCLFLSIWSVAVPLCRPLLPCPSRWDGSLPRAWSVMADLWVAMDARVCVPAVKESTSFLCSLILRPNFLPVSPIYELEQFSPGHVLHRAVNSQQDVIKMSDGHRNVVIR